MDGVRQALQTLLAYFGQPVGVSMQELGRDAYVDLPMKVRVGDLMDAREALATASSVHVVLCVEPGGDGEVHHIFSSSELAHEYAHRDSARTHVLYRYVLDCPELHEERVQ